MRKVSIFRNRNNQAIRLPKEFEFPGATELVIEKRGDALVLRPVRPDWRSFADLPDIEGVDDFLVERPPVFVERSVFSDEDNADPSRSAAKIGQSEARYEDGE
jgi:antitoxin VapB